MAKEHTMKAQYYLVVDNYFENGFNKEQATLAAGYSDRAYARVLFKHPQIVAEIEKRKRRQEARYDISKEKVLAEYAKFAFTRFDDYSTIDPETGDAMVDLSKVSEETLAAIGEYTIETYMEGRGENAREVKKVRIKMSDKQKALDAISRLMGYNEDSVTIKGGLSIVERLQEGRNRVRDITPRPNSIEHEE